MKRLRSLALLLGLVLVAGQAVGEVAAKSLSVSQTVTSYTFPARTKVVLVISDGASTCFYRLFSNTDTPADATASATGNLQIKTGESKVYDLNKQSTDVASSSLGAATAWKSISAICDTGQTATFRIESF